MVDAVPINKEIIVVDDYSTDGTRELLQQFPEGQLKLVCHPHNCGKGTALRTGFQHATGDVIIIQDADLEYDPNDYLKVIEPIREGRCDVVYGSRFLGQHRFTSQSHYWGNRGLTWLTNLLFGSDLTDMETCYKAVRADILKKLPLTAERFDIEPEITALLLKRGLKIHEVPISYNGREFEDGKKISWRDGYAAVKVLVRHRFLSQQPEVSLSS